MILKAELNHLNGKMADRPIWASPIWKNSSRHWHYLFQPSLCKLHSVRVEYQCITIQCTCCREQDDSLSRCAQASGQINEQVKGENGTTGMFGCLANYFPPVGRDLMMGHSLTVHCPWVLHRWCQACLEVCNVENWSPLSSVCRMRHGHRLL